MSIHDDLSRVADLVHGSACSTEPDKQAWARIRAYIDDQRRRIDAAGETLRAIGLGVCDRCRLEWRDPDGAGGDCPRCRTLALQGEAGRGRRPAAIVIIEGDAHNALHAFDSTVSAIDFYNGLHVSATLYRVDEWHPARPGGGAAGGGP